MDGLGVGRRAVIECSVYQLLSLTKICKKHVAPEGQVVMKEGEMLVQPIAILIELQNLCKMTRLLAGPNI